MYLTQEDYEAKKAELPDIVYAFKYPIKDMVDKPFQEMAGGDLLEDAEDAKHNVLCDSSKKDIEGVRYYAVSMVNNEEIEVNLSEQAFFNPNEFDMMPHIFYRLTKPLKEDAKLPTITLSDFYAQTEDYGF